jgi:hypothetical protein
MAAPRDDFLLQSDPPLPLFDDQGTHFTYQYQAAQRIMKERRLKWKQGAKLEWKLEDVESKYKDVYEGPNSQTVVEALTLNACRVLLLQQASLIGGKIISDTLSNGRKVR